MSVLTGVMLDAALAYAARGAPIFPTWGVHEDGRCCCGSARCEQAGKHPHGRLAPHGFKDATTDAVTIRRWWMADPAANIATHTRWCVVLDVDPEHGGADSLAELEHQHGALPDTPRVLTGGGGTHHYFAAPASVSVKNSAGKVGPGLDVRASDGYVLVPPSRHASGRDYRDDAGAPLFETPLAPMPAWLLARMTAAEPSTNGHVTTSGVDWAARLRGAPRGQRHAIAAQMAGHYLGKGHAPVEVAALLMLWSAQCAPPFPEAEARRIVADLAAKDAAKEADPAHEEGRPVGLAGDLDSIWASAVALPAFLQQADEVVDFLEPRLLVRGAITEVFSPRGLGKTQVTYAIGLRLARAGRRVLLVDRDNPRHEIRRRLRKWGGDDAAQFKVITRNQAPALTDADAWSAFPLDTYDVVIIDSIDATTEGVGEGDSAKPSLAFAAVLDLARRADGPAILVLGNVIKSGAHSRGSGVLEDRADIVYEVRDATDLKPTGKTDWWHELAPSGVGNWAQRASRRKRREVYRLAFIASKFRLGEEPEPFVLEVDHRTESWSLRDVTEEIVEVGQESLRTALSEREQQAARATQQLLADMRHRADGGKPPLTKGEAEQLLQAAGLKRAEARGLVTDGAGRLWHLSPGPNPGGKGTSVFLTFQPLCEASTAAKKGGEETPRQTTLSGLPFAADRMDTGRQRSALTKPSIHAGPSEGLSSPPKGNIHSAEGHGGEGM